MAAGDRDKALDVALANIEKQFGKGSVMRLGEETRALSSLWDGLECFAAYGDEIEPAPLATAAGEAVGRAPDAAGLVDHARIGSEWERSQGAVSIVDMLFAELST